MVYRSSFYNNTFACSTQTADIIFHLTPTGFHGKSIHDTATMILKLCSIIKRDATRNQDCRSKQDV